MRSLTALLPLTFGLQLTGMLMLGFVAWGVDGASQTARAADCGSVSIAEMNWASAGLAAHVDKIILEQGFGCRVTLVPGDTMPTFATMTEKGTPDLAPEFWVNTAREQLDRAVKDGRIIEAAQILSDGGVEGWWIPKFIADANPEIRTVSDALKRPELFAAPEDKTRGIVTNCPMGWACQITTGNLFRALDGTGKGFTLVDSASAGALDASIAKAFETKSGWLGYYWAPTAILGKYQMVKLSMDNAGFDKAEWDRCTTVPGCPQPKVNSYPVADVYTIATKSFVDKAAVGLDYIRKRQWDNQTVSRVLAWMSQNKASNADGARYFLRTYPDLWATWVNPALAEKVRAGL